MKTTHDNQTRRHFLSAATGFVTGAGVVGLSVPFVGSWRPSAKAKAIGAPVRINTGKIDRGQMISVEWQGKPVFVLRRSQQALKELANEKNNINLRDPFSETNNQPGYAKNTYRSIKPEILVVIGICTHLGCVPDYKPSGLDQSSRALYFCPCHGSKFDLAGCVFKGVPAPSNLMVPPHQYLDNVIIEIARITNRVVNMVYKHYCLE